MLTLNQIKEYFSSPFARSNPKGMLVEYLQYEFLDSLFKLAGSQHLSFIGGTAIRFIYDSQRFSEDLDFDNFGLSYSGFSRLVKEASRELKVKGFSLDLRILKREKVFHAYIKFPEVLRQYAVSAHHQEKIFISVDAERKKELYDPEITTLNKFGIFRNMPAAPSSILLSQKLIAVLFRKQEKGRDFYDVSFLSALTRPDYAYIKQTTGLSTLLFIEKLRARCKKFNYLSLAKDVSPFLFDAGQTERVLNFNKTLELLFKHL